MPKTNIKWCTGIPSIYNESGIQRIGRSASVYPQKYIKKGYMEGRIMGFIQQESTFWRKELWNKAGGIDTNYKYAVLV